jgi:hypothetical protein
MSVARRRLLPLVAAAIFAVAPAAAAGRGTVAGPLTGTWSGYIAGSSDSGVRRERIVIAVNARETAGSWKLSATCQGPLTLESISNGYHHFLQRLARGSTCAGGDVDCLKRVGAEVYDAVTSHLGGAYDSGGTLRRVRSKPR